MIIFPRFLHGPCLRAHTFWQLIPVAVRERATCTFPQRGLSLVESSSVCPSPPLPTSFLLCRRRSALSCEPQWRPWRSWSCGCESWRMNSSSASRCSAPRRRRTSWRQRTDPESTRWAPRWWTPTRTGEDTSSARCLPECWRVSPRCLDGGSALLWVIHPRWRWRKKLTSVCVSIAAAWWR